MAESMGVDTARYRIKVFVLAALLAAVSGWLYAHMQRFVNPTPFNLNIGIEYLFMAVVGGAGHLWGAVLGAALITLLKEQLQDILPQPARLQRQLRGDRVRPADAVRAAALCRRPVADAGAPRRPLPASRKPVARPAPRRLRCREPPAAARAGRCCRPTRSPSASAAWSPTTRSTMDVKAGEIHALIGPNGAGKSTFFNMISGVDDPTAGEVRLMDEPMTGQPSRAFAALGLGRTFQHVRLLGQRSVLENVALGAHRRGRRGWIASMLRLDRAEEAALLAEARRQIERCGLGEHRRRAGRLAGAGPAARGRDRARAGRPAGGAAARRAGRRPAPPGEARAGRRCSPNCAPKGWASWSWSTTWSSS